jgi:hypothetical protein
MQQQTKAILFQPLPGAPEAGGAAFGPVPGPEELAHIHRFTLEPLPADQLYVRRMALANTRLDRSFERFSPGYLQRFAQTLPGKSLLIAHDTHQLASGLVYQAEVVPTADGEQELVACFYLPVTASTQEVRRCIDAGVVRYVSIGFTYDQRLCSVCHQEYWDCRHLPGEMILPPDGPPGGQLVTYTYAGDLARVEAREASLVYLGAQRGAAIIKEISPMENEKALARVRELEGQIKALEERIVTHEREKAQLVTANEALRQKVESLPPQAPLPPAGEGCPKGGVRALADEGLAYRDSLREEAKRLAGLLKLETEANLLLTALQGATAAELKELVESYRARVEERFPPRARRREVTHAAGESGVEALPRRPMVLGLRQGFQVFARSGVEVRHRPAGFCRNLNA